MSETTLANEYMYEISRWYLENWPSFAILDGKITPFPENFWIVWYTNFADVNHSKTEDIRSIWIRSVTFSDREATLRICRDGFLAQRSFDFFWVASRVRGSTLFGDSLSRKMEIASDIQHNFMFDAMHVLAAKKNRFKMKFLGYQHLTSWDSHV